MKDWKDINKEKPERGLTVETKDSEGVVRLAYLCKHCGNEWRCAMTGYGLMIDVVQWRRHLTTASTGQQ